MLSQMRKKCPSGRYPSSLFFIFPVFHLPVFIFPVMKHFSELTEHIKAIVMAFSFLSPSLLNMRTGEVVVCVYFSINPDWAVQVTYKKEKRKMRAANRELSQELCWEVQKALRIHSPCKDYWHLVSVVSWQFMYWLCISFPVKQES